MRNKWVRRLAIAAGGLVALVAVSAVTVWALGARQIARTLDVPARPLTVARDSTAVARGAHLVDAIGKCADCHGENLAGTLFINDPGLGRVVAPNLTPGGRLASWSDAEIDRALRHGVAKDGRRLMIMPSSEYNAFSDEDAAAIIAHLRSLPPVAQALPANDVKFLGRALIVTGQMPVFEADRIDHARAASPSVPPAVSVEYGRYLAQVGGCMGCHGPGLSGGKIPGTPPEWKPATNISPRGIGSWTEADFFRALREGRRPDGTPIDTIMPWKRTARMTDDEIRAVWRFLESVPAREYGLR